MKFLKKNNVMVQQHYIPIYKFSIYKEHSISFPGAEKYFNSSVSLPIFVNLNKINQNKVIQLIKNYFKL